MRSLLALLLAVTSAAAAGLNVGDPAPSKLPTTFLKGTKVAALDPKKTYIVEFWATWCGPCIASMPHLSELQTKLKEDGVTVMSIHVASGVETADAFVKKEGKKMEYTVAKDTAKGDVGKAWMTAAGQNGIPCAFVVVNGKVAYIGHPGSLTEAKIKSLMTVGATPPAKTDPKVPAKK